MASVGLEHPGKLSVNPQISQTGGANSGAPGGESHKSDNLITRNLVAALVLIADLPLSKEEKAQAVRRLLQEDKAP